MRQIAIIGGGAAGLAAACSALDCGASVTLFERNDRVGKKLCITGKGRGNVTNHCDPKSFLDRVIRGKKFLYSALYSFTPFDTEEWLEALGVPLKVERGNRVFPVSDRAADVRDALISDLKRKGGFRLVCARVSDLIPAEDSITVLTEKGNRSVFDAVILATGGLSYPATGSTGDGYRIAKKIGHRIVAQSPSLVPIVCGEDFCRDLEGLTLKNVRLSLLSDAGKKPEYSELGELVFTANGISGPLALTASAYLSGGTFPKKLELDLKPALSDEQFERRLLREFAENQNKEFKNALNVLLPASFRPVMTRLSGIEADKRIHQITKAEREKLISCFKRLALTASSLGSFQEAIVTKGGVALDEIDPHTMRSRIVKRLYFAGEMIDADAFTGGYNLQIAFSTGMLAGKHCAISADFEQNKANIL